MNEQPEKLFKPEIMQAESGQSPQPPTPVQYWMRPGGEIDLVDVGVLLWRRRWLMLAVFLVFMVLTIIATVFKRPTYEYTTTVQLGTVISQTSGNVLPFMSAQSVAQTLRDIYLPGAMNQYVTDNHLNPATVQFPDITAAGGSDGYEVVLNCRVQIQWRPACIAVEQLAAENLIKDNWRLTTAAQDRLVSLQAQAVALRSQWDKLDTAATQYQQQARALQQLIDRLQKAKSDTPPKTGVTRGSSGSIMNIELQRADASLSIVQQNLIVGVLQQRAQLSQQLAENLRAQQLQQQAIDRSQSRILNTGLRSLQPVGISRRSMLEIGITLSVILALIAAFAAAYIERVRTRLTTEIRS